MLSRVANAVYWSSRYVERAENVARFVDVNLNLMLDSTAHARPSWEPLVLTSGDQEYFEKHYGAPSADAVAWFLTFDRSYPNSILSTVSRARENAQTVREVISREMWQELNEFYLMVKEASSKSFSLEKMGEFYQQTKRRGIYYEGITEATLSHGEAWYFTRLGRLLERADKTSRILDVKYFILLPSIDEVGGAIDQVGWAALLSSASALQMYRQHYHTTTPHNVASFLLLDKYFPRSMNYCVRRSKESLQGITGATSEAGWSAPERQLGQLREKLSSDKIGDVMSVGLHQYIDQLQLSLNNISSAIEGQFFDMQSQGAS